MKNGGLLLCLRVQDCCFLVSLCGEDRRLFLSLCQRDDLTLLALRLHLLFHGLADRVRRKDVLQLHTVHLDAPGIRRHIQLGTHLRIDGLTGSEGGVQVHGADDVSKRRGRQVLNCRHRVLNAVGIEPGLRDHEEHDGVDAHRDVVFRDDRLGREVRHLLLQIDLFCDAVNDGDHEVHARIPGRTVLSQTLDDYCLSLGDDADAGQRRDNRNDEQKKNKEHSCFLLRRLMQYVKNSFSISQVPSRGGTG